MTTFIQTVVRRPAVLRVAAVLLSLATAVPAFSQELEGVDDVPAGAEAPVGGEAADLPPSSPLPTLIMFGGLIALWFYIIIRPQQKERAKRQSLIDSLKTHAEVITIGGIHGKIVKATEGSATVTIQVDQNTRLTVNRDAVREVIDPDQPADPPK